MSGGTYPGEYVQWKFADPASTSRPTSTTSLQVAASCNGARVETCCAWLYFSVYDLYEAGKRCSFVQARRLDKPTIHVGMLFNMLATCRADNRAHIGCALSAASQPSWPVASRLTVYCSHVNRSNFFTSSRPSFTYLSLHPPPPSPADLPSRALCIASHPRRNVRVLSWLQTDRQIDRVRFFIDVTVFQSSRWNVSIRSRISVPLTHTRQYVLLDLYYPNSLDLVQV